jgi:hypothetical protein
MVLASFQPSSAEPPDAATLVRQVRSREAWIERVDSLQIKAVQEWERTPKGIEHRRRELVKSFPEGPWENHPDLRPRSRWIVEQAYDRKRIRLRVQEEGYSDDLRIWDGKQFTLQNRYADWPGVRPDQDGTLISRDLKRGLSWLVWTNLASFRAGPHVFWWNSLEQCAEIERMAAKSEDFAYEGKADFHGISCHVVSHWDSWTSLFIGVDDGRLHGLRSGSLTTPKAKRSIMELLRQGGRQIQDEKDLERQTKSITDEERRGMAHLGSARLTQLIDPVFEYRLALNKEVAPGCPFPLHQWIRFFTVGDDGLPFESQTQETKILEVKVNETLPDSLFVVAFKEGERITDQTTDPPLEYRYKAKMTEEEWATIRANARTKAEKRAEQLRAARQKRARR